MILIMGLPGAGKSVQSGLIRDRLGFHWLSTGQLLRETDEPEILAVQKSGGLVSDGLIFKMVGDKLREIGYDNDFLLDGFPRNVAQAEWLVAHAEEVGKHVRLVLYLVVDEAVARERLGSRGRPDDDEATIKKRREEAEKILPTLEYLKSRGIPVHNIDANGGVESIFTAIKTAIEQV